MDKATKSGTIVSSLFPSHVRDRLMESVVTPAATERETWRATDHILNKSRHSGSEELPLGRAIAEKYPEATVLFADLVGFTQWSKSREPEDVFQLLETLYSAFDAIASKRGVYKIETIGGKLRRVDDKEPASSYRALM